MPPTAVAFGFTLWQFEYRPRAPKKDEPQKRVKGAATRPPRRAAPRAGACGFRLGQFEYGPRAQKKHDPQKTLNGTITRSPRFRFCTEEPTSSTTPMNSCPKVIPTRVSGIIPW